MEDIKVKEAAIYPYNPELVGIVRHLNQMNYTIRIKRVVAPKGFRCDGKDAGLLYNKPEMGIAVTENIEEAIDDCDCLIIADGSYLDRLRSVIIQNMYLALQMGKEVICTMKLTDDELVNITGKDNHVRTPFSYNPEYLTLDELKTNTIGKLYSPQAPVVFISEAISGLDAFEITLGMTNYIRQEGYRTVTIAEKSLGGLLNIKSTPEFMWGCKMDDNDKVYALNQYIKQLEQKEKPDIIVIQLPGSIMKFNDKLTAGFGILPYLIGLAVQADYMIFCSNFLTIEPIYFEKLSERFDHQIGIGIDAIHVSNVMVDVGASMENRQFSIVRIGQNRVNEEVVKLMQNGDMPAYNGCNAEECKMISSGIIESLKTWNVT